VDGVLHARREVPATLSSVGWSGTAVRSTTGTDIRQLTSVSALSDGGPPHASLWPVTPNCLS